jgi:hypothetical protein
MNTTHTLCTLLMTALPAPPASERRAALRGHNFGEVVATKQRISADETYGAKAFTSSRPTDAVPVLLSTTRSWVVLTVVNVTVLYWLTAIG